MAAHLTVGRVAALRKKPGRYRDGYGLVLQVVNPNNASWLFCYERNGRERAMGLGPLHTVGLREARKRALAARQLLLNDIDPLDHKRAEHSKRAAAVAKNVIFRDIPSRWADFIVRGITPTCYLYRHYDYQGDLLYVGLSNSPLERQRKHRDGSHWAAMVCTITIEPFAAREDAIAAEQLAIETEFPKHNQTYNGGALPRAVERLMEAERIEPNNRGYKTPVIWLNLKLKNQYHLSRVSVCAVPM